MKGKVVKNLKVLNGKKLFVTGVLGLVVSIDTAWAPTVTVNAYIEKVDPDRTEERSDNAMKNLMEIANQVAIVPGELEYHSYLAYLADLYHIDAQTLELHVKMNTGILLEQESIENGLQTMIEQNIENGSLQQETERTEKKVRLTTYQYTPDDSEKRLGGSVGLVAPYLEEGSMYFDENGFAMWKGGTKSKLNGKVYGEEGTDYLVVATATNALIGQYTYEENDNIQYYDYNDTFKLEVTTKNGTKEYQAIVLDSCGACMDWSTTSDGVYAPKTEKEKGYCSLTNSTKIDIFTAPSNDPKLTDPKDTGMQIKERKPVVEEIQPMPEVAKNYMEQQTVYQVLEPSAYTKIKK